MVHALLDASIVVLEREGMLGFSTNRVAQVAGASVGSLYQYFANKEALISGIVERGVLAAEDQIRDLMNVPMEPSDLVRLLLHSLVETLAPFASLIGELLASAPMLSRGGIMSILEPRLLDATRDYLLASSDRIRATGGPATLYVIVSSTAFTVLKWLAEQPRHVPEEALVDGLVRQILCHVEAI